MGQEGRKDVKERRRGEEVRRGGEERKNTHTHTLTQTVATLLQQHLKL